MGGAARPRKRHLAEGRHTNDVGMDDAGATRSGCAILLPDDGFEPDVYLAGGGLARTGYWISHSDLQYGERGVATPSAIQGFGAARGCVFSLSEGRDVSHLPNRIAR